MTQRKIESVYYCGAHMVKRTKATYPNNAVANAVMHMTVNDYRATHVEIFNGETGYLYAVLRNRLVKGKLQMSVMFKSEIEGRAEQ